ncbi:hypothetical protein [Scopulibacillus cellulosilyticus]|uniref:Phospholipase D-like protein n=1 Tax=Scopulibacillus cellulosilyticus TaxID=2665665 RepID=A0ABW2Q0U1_9BACL
MDKEAIIGKNIDMTTILIFLSFYPWLFVFFIFVALRMDQWAKTSLFLLVLWLMTMPFAAIFIDDSKKEKNTKSKSKPNKS